jgi:D-alanyl-D-alanine carboxypeptidase/D-alanyl-D-alanine-endopeptidase (penicillin-binding protein 4)
MPVPRSLLPLRSLTTALVVGTSLTACGGIAIRTGHPPVDPAPTRRDSTLGALRDVITAMVEAPAFANAHWGVLIVDPVAGDTLYSRNAGKLFMPASNQKIITGAVALARLGPTYRWRTPVVATGPVANGVLRGDLAVIGSGDPGVSDRVLGDAMKPLRMVADSLAARGVRRISGQVLATGDAFPDAIYGFGWAWDDFEFGYSAGVDELLFNEGITRVTVMAGAQPGVAPTVTVRPAQPDVALRMEATTVEPPTPASGGGEPRRVRAALDSERDRETGAIRITGSIPAGDSATLTIVHRDPSAAYLAALRQALAERGIVVEGRANTAPATPATDTIAVIVSPTLAEMMPAFEKPSQNQMGEMLFKTLGRQATGVGTADSGRRVVEAQLAAWQVPLQGAVIRDGSGLSRHNYVSPATLVRVLDVVRRDSALAAVLIPSLPLAGVDGTLASRMRGTPAAGNVHAKTGYIDRARSLSGYVTTRDGRTLVFSLLANNWTAPLREVERVQDEIVTRLAALDLGPLPATAK